MTAYLEMWIRYCKHNRIWFAVCADGSIEQVTACNECDTVEPDMKYEFGSRAAYEWLVRWHTTVKTAGKGEPE